MCLRTVLGPMGYCLHIFVQGKVMKLLLLIFLIAAFVSFNSFIISYSSLLDTHFPPVLTPFDSLYLLFIFGIFLYFIPQISPLMQNKHLKVVNILYLVIDWLIALILFTTLRREGFYLYYKEDG